MKKILISAFLLWNIAFGLWAQNFISHTGSSNYTLVERTNLRQYVNGKYIGLQSREVRSFIVNEGLSADGSFYAGDFFVQQDTVTNNRSVAGGIHDAIPASFTIAANGKLTMKIDNGYPSFRSFPVFPDDKILPGATWKAESVRAIDPLNKGIVTKIPMTVLYTFKGEEIYKEEPVYRISAQWATRYGISYWDWGGDRDLKSAQGSHKANILVSKNTGSMVFMTDMVDETFLYNDGTQINFKGTILQFTEYPVSIQHEEFIRALNRIGAVVAGTSVTVQTEQPSQEELLSSGEQFTAGNSLSDEVLLLAGDGEVSDSAKDSLPTAEELLAQLLEKSESKILVEETDAGLKLQLHDLKFKADSDELMPGESARLDEIAAVLKMAASSMFLVEGHTARTGYTEGEMNVSKARALRIAGELVKRGIDGDRFICKGWGSQKPIASNETGEGKAMNRRVEITILE